MDRTGRRHDCLMMIPLALFLMLCFQGGHGRYTLPDSVQIGGLFVKGSKSEQAFNFAVHRINRLKAPENDTTLVSVKRHIAGGNSFDAYKRVCSLLSQEGGIAAVFGPSTLEGNLAVDGVCDRLQVPHITARWEHKERPSSQTDLKIVNLYPHNRYISLLLSNLTESYAWTKMTIVYQDEEALIRLHHVLERSRGELTLRKMTAQNLNMLLKEIKKSGIYHIIIDCKQEVLMTILELLLELQMLRSHYHYIFTSMDMCLIEMTRYSGDSVNISSIHLMDMTSTDVKSKKVKWEFYQKLEGSNETAFTTEVAMMYDAVSVAKLGLHRLSNTSLVSTQQVSCESTQSAWDLGLSYYNAVQSVNMPDGLTGQIRFGSHGERVNPKFFVSELGPSGMEQIGTWNIMDGLHFKRAVEEQLNTSTANRSLRVTTILEKPYVMLRETTDGTKLADNERFEGFCIDLLKMVSADVGFDYQIQLVNDGNYGAETENGEWNGMIGELMQGQADLAVAPLTISYVREQVVDFSKPFMHLGITILYRVPEPQNPGVFSFLNPLSFDIWMYVVIAFLVVALTMFLLARFSPYEWYNEHPCNPDYDKVENQFTLLSCIWFAFGGLMQQGSEVNPRAFSTRVLSGFWWFFSLILVSSYTANLAAFLTVERMVSPIESADDMAKQTKIEYGTRSSGSTHTFFKRSNIETYKTMWEFMSSRPNVFMDTYGEGIQRVLTEKNYAFLMESTMAEYVVSRNCKNLTTIGGLLNSRGYGIGTPLGSKLRDKITNSILRLEENEDLMKLKTKWWNAGNCMVEPTNNQDANELGLSNIGGIFLVLIAGVVLGILVAVAEFIWKSRQNAEIDRKSLCAEMMSEFRFACRCNGKPRSQRNIDHKYMPAPYPSGLNGQTFPMSMAETVA
ncbi:glutamate receptor ionotropic, kainate 2-like [Acanthaster planci]|uniref:Glutamate receptor ionotropic, kainate 2-like n=1 Tax=Acanthaster planci TaxID=133434 RepID=A0A8B7ZCV5_ACAPL|nr:glutamate receptor ionotropic, kainate 2-like [Acanthaster planci]XP_022103508.1 glutamate receptor ionotropic, kainate 2-like [Acanthaster planci]XP_022103509.1 glutamate receptor ionotropic, kainate 2-like [Acanthaster planci]